MDDPPPGEPSQSTVGPRVEDPVRVLYVGDDERPARRFAGERDHFEVTAATGADDALDELAIQRVDCVVSEYDLPDRDGLDLLERVRRTEPGLPFVLFAADGDEATASAAISADVTDYVRKGALEEPHARLADRVESAVEDRRTDRKPGRNRRLLETQAAAMTASIDGMAILDEDGTYQFVNQAHADIYGYEARSAFVGNSWQMCYEQSELDRFEEEVLPTLEASGGWRGEAVGLRKDGSTFPQELSLSRTADGGLVCVVRDITDRKERERELQAERNRLADFADIVSHDLRNPLNVASGTLTLLEEELEDELDDHEHDLDGDPEAASVLDRVETIADAHDRMGVLIDDLLSLARGGGTVEASERVDLDSAVEEAWRHVETRGADLRASTDATVLADASRLQQLLENLFRNAVEHGSTGNQTEPRSDDAVEHGSTSSGSRARQDALEDESPSDSDALAVTVGLIDGDEGNPEGFYVADDGRGIPPEDRDTVFEAGESSREDGTGFGLAIVDRIADAHDWSVSVTASDVGGARFDVTGVEFA